MGKWALLLYRLFYLLVFLALSWIVFRVSGAILGIWGSALLFLLTYILSVFVHEAGHILAARVAGWRILLVALGGLMWVRRRRGYSLRIYRGFLPTGFTYAAPVQDKNLDRRLFWGILSGPLSGLLFSLVCAAWLWLISPGGIAIAMNLSGLPHPVLWSGLLCCSVISLLISINSLIPGEDALGASDGQKLRQILAKTPSSRALLALVALEGADQRGVRPKDWPEDKLAQLLAADLPGGLRIPGSLVNYFAALDRQEFQKAGEHLDMALLFSRGASLPTISLYQEAAFFNAMYRKDPELARNWFALIRPGFFDTISTDVRAQAAIQLAEGNLHQAQVLVEKSLGALENSLATGKAEAERDLLCEVMRASSGAQDLLGDSH